MAKECLCSALALVSQLEELRQLDKLKEALPIDEKVIEFRKRLAKASADDVAEECKIDVEMMKRGIDTNLYDDVLADLLERLKCPVFKSIER